MTYVKRRGLTLVDFILLSNGDFVARECASYQLTNALQFWRSFARISGLLSSDQHVLEGNANGRAVALLGLGIAVSPNQG